MDGHKAAGIQKARQQAEKSGGGISSWGDEPNVAWIIIPAIGLLVGWWAMGVSYVLGTWSAGKTEGWPGPLETLKAAGSLVTGERLDVAWLESTDATAIATAIWLCFFVVIALAVAAAVGIAVYEWAGVGWMTGKEKKGGKKSKEKANPHRDFVRWKWPVPPPYDWKCTGPGVLIGKKGGFRHLVAVDGLPTLVVGPTGSGKTRNLLGPNAANWPGPVVATSVKKDMAELTIRHREQKGRIFAFEPTGGMHDWMVENGITPVSWNPVKMLAAEPNKKYADLLSQFLASQSSSHGQGSQAIWANLVQASMSQMLLIAHETGTPLSTVLEWLTKLASFTDLAKDKLFVSQLSPDAATGLAKLALDAERDPRLAGSIEVTASELTKALEWTAEEVPGVEPVPVDVAVNGSNDTLYLVADHMSQTTHKPLFGAVLRHLFHVTETLEQDPDKTYTRPLFALDEFANLAKLPDMPEVISTIRSRAQVMIGIQTPAQLASSWGKEGATTIADNCTTKIFFPGSSDTDALRNMVALATDKEDEKDGDLSSAAAWRMVKKGKAVILSGNRPAFTAELADPDVWLKPPKPVTQEEPDREPGGETGGEETGPDGGTPPQPDANPTATANSDRPAGPPAGRPRVRRPQKPSENGDPRTAVRQRRNTDALPARPNQSVHGRDTHRPDTVPDLSEPSEYPMAPPYDVNTAQHRRAATAPKADREIADSIRSQLFDQQPFEEEDLTPPMMFVEFDETAPPPRPTKPRPIAERHPDQSHPNRGGPPTQTGRRSDRFIRSRDDHPQPGHPKPVPNAAPPPIPQEQPAATYQQPPAQPHPAQPVPTAAQEPPPPQPHHQPVQQPVQQPPLPEHLPPVPVAAGHEVPVPVESNGHGEPPPVVMNLDPGGGSGVKRQEQVDGWVPPPVLSSANDLGINSQGVRYRDHQEALKRYVDDAGEFGVHPAGCVFDLSNELESELEQV